MAYDITLLSSPDMVKVLTPLTHSVDDNIIVSAMWQAQERYIHPTLGTDLYNKLKTDVEGSISGVYKTLLETYVTPCLVQYTYAEAIPILRVRFVNHAAVTTSAEQGSSATEQDVKPLINSAMQVAQWHRERMIDYLCANSGKYPEYTSNSYPDVQPTRRNYTGGLNVDPTYKDRELELVRQLLGIKV